MDEKTKMLLEAAKEGNDAGVLRALELGADVNAMRPLTSLTALLLALEWNHFATREIGANEAYHAANVALPAFSHTTSIMTSNTHNTQRRT